MAQSLDRCRGSKETADHRTFNPYCREIYSGRYCLLSVAMATSALAAGGDVNASFTGLAMQGFGPVAYLTESAPTSYETFAGGKGNLSPVDFFPPPVISVITEI
ncbi:MAG: hypothetical protein MJH10_02250 [Epibacterium sp.]|nr:hypothetical protein [Epibacterium sp.]NQX72378.1 hypothetical protein [Epibacterium sp.]